MYMTIFSLVITLTFDLFTSKPNIFIFVPKYTKLATLAKFSKWFMKYRVNKLFGMHERTYNPPPEKKHRHEYQRLNQNTYL